MHILDIHSELSSHYNGCYGIDKDNRVLFVHEVLQPDADSVNDWGEDEYRSYPTDLDVHEAFDFFETRADLYHNYDFYNHSSSKVTDRVQLSDINFVFPESKLVQFRVRTDEEHDKYINIVKYLSRYSVRQYRRGLRREHINSSIPNLWLFAEANNYSTNKYVAEDCVYGVNTQDIISFIQPEHYIYADALDKLGSEVGTYSVTNSWWVGQGRDELSIGWKSYTVGSVNEDSGKIKLFNEMKFLTNDLNESLGDVIE